MTSDDREKLAKRLRDIAARTVENGCTEAEAVAAAAKLAKLLAEHNMTLDEAFLRESRFTQTAEPIPENHVGDRLWKPADAIAKLTNTRYWTSTYPATISFFGFAHEVEIAKYLLAICNRAMTNGETKVNRDWALVTPVKRRAKVIAYLDGMADTLRRRIMELIPPVPMGVGLMVLHESLLDENMPVKIGKSSAGASREFDPQYLVGMLEAQRVALNPGVAHDERTQPKIN